MTGSGKLFVLLVVSLLFVVAPVASASYADFVQGFADWLTGRTTLVPDAVPISSSPKGWLDPVGCDGFSGWACDADDFSRSLSINVYVDGSFLVSTTANMANEAAVTAECGGVGGHRFSVGLPSGLKDGVQHVITAYAVDYPSGNNVLLNGGGQSVQCGSAAPVNVAPVVVSFSSSSGSFGPSDTVAFVGVFRDVDGAGDVKRVYLAVALANTADAPSGDVEEAYCKGFERSLVNFFGSVYYPASNSYSVAKSLGSGGCPWTSVASGATETNGVGSVELLGVSSSRSGDDVVVSWSVKFSKSVDFPVGAYNVYLMVVDNGEKGNGPDGSFQWVKKGAVQVVSSVSPACSAGQVESRSCGNCGSQSRTCAAGQWGSWGSCQGQGVCSSGVVESRACSGSSQKQTRTCSAQCGWGVWVPECPVSVVPSASVSGPSVGKVGDSLTYTARVSGTDLNKGELWVATPDFRTPYPYVCAGGVSGAWCLIKHETLSGASGSLSGAWVAGPAGSYVVAVNGYDVAGGKCSGNPQLPLPAGWVECGLNDSIKVVVSVPSCTPNCAGKGCGSDGCGGSCGICGSGEDCSSGVCVKRAAPSAAAVPVLVLKYFPLDGGGVRLDKGKTGVDKSLSEIRAHVSQVTDGVVAALEFGSTYHGYKDSVAVPSLDYSIYGEKEFLASIPQDGGRADEFKVLKNSGFDICDYVDNKGVKEVWVWMYHTTEVAPIESNMAMGTLSRQFWNHGDYGDVSNSYEVNDLPVCQKTYAVYEYNYQRGVGEAVEDHTHHFEKMFKYLDYELFWGRFVGYFPSSGAPEGVTERRCGWTHFPPNGKEDYDWANQAYVASDCEDWTPDGVGVKKQINCGVWNCDGTKFKVWWMQNLPGKNNGLIYDGKVLRNWWDFVADFDAALAAGKNLVSSQSSSSPKGWLDPVSCEQFRGWACDADDYSRQLNINIYDNGVLVASTTANVVNEPAVTAECGGKGNHRFSVAIPSGLRDGKKHVVSAYALDYPSGNGVVLFGGGQSVQCGSPVPVEPKKLAFSGYDTHPDFWPAGVYSLTAKKYVLAPGSQVPVQNGVPYDAVWVLSGPYKPAEPAGQRSVIYQPYLDNIPGEYMEWERWSYDAENHVAVVHSFGSSSETTNSLTYLTSSDCDKGVTGHAWPNLASGQDFNYVSESFRVPGVAGCLSHWAGSEHPGGYTAIKLKEFWSSSNSLLRVQKCDDYVPASVSSSANSICKDSPNVGIVYQRYVRGTDALSTVATYSHGCEATVYAWGYQDSASENYRYWFRNGELRWSYWLNLGRLAAARAPDDDAWWDSQCQAAWSQKPNMVYTGTYRLDGTDYEDSGNSINPALTPGIVPAQASKQEYGSVGIAATASKAVSVVVNWFSSLFGG